jgi:apolipoprotein N-acyltransferase
MSSRNSPASQSEEAVAAIWCAGVAVFGLGVVWHGYALMVLWGWFVSPALGLAPLTLSTAIGIQIIVGLLAAQRDRGGNEDKWHLLIELAMKPAIALVAGWIVKLWGQA